MITTAELGAPRDKEPSFSVDQYLQTNWQEIPAELRQKLVKKYGQPIVVPHIQFEIEERQFHGVCNANEKSITAMSLDSKFWNHYGVALINDYMIRYNLATSPRILSDKIIIGETGGVIFPGMIYTEDDSYRQDGLGPLIYSQGTQHQTSAGHYGTFYTYHLRDTQQSFKLTPIREFGSFSKVNIEGKTCDVNFDTLKSLIRELSIEAFSHEETLYAQLYNDLEAYFEDPAKVKQVETLEALERHGEINASTDTLLKKEQRIQIPKNITLPAIEDPVAFNDGGHRVFIIKYNEGYYFCPAKSCRVME